MSAWEDRVDCIVSPTYDPRKITAIGARDSDGNMLGVVDVCNSDWRRCIRIERNYTIVSAIELKVAPNSVVAELVALSGDEVVAIANRNSAFTDGGLPFVAKHPWTLDVRIRIREPGWDPRSLIAELGL
jgi:hypothetical protein